MHGLRILNIATAAILAIGLFGGSADAQALCGKRDDIVAQLEKKYGETRRSVGVQEGRGVVEVYASSSTGSWLASPSRISTNSGSNHSFNRAASSKFESAF